MTKTILEGNEPFAERPPLKRRLIKGLAITIGALVVAIGGLAWFRFQPAFTQPAPSAIAVNQPAWGTATALPPPAAAPAAPTENTAAVTSAGASANDAKAATKPRTKPKAQSANAKRQSTKAPPEQIAKTP